MDFGTLHIQKNPSPPWSPMMVPHLIRAVHCLGRLLRSYRHLMSASTARTALPGARDRSPLKIVEGNGYLENGDAMAAPKPGKYCMVY